jgi:hypothetical protein
MNQRNVLRLVVQRQGPVERRVAAPQDDQALADQAVGVAHPVVDIALFPWFGAEGAQPSRLERAEACRQDHGGRVKTGSGRRLQLEAAFRRLFQSGYRLAQVKLRFERRNLLHQAVHEFLGAANGQGGNVVNGLVRIEFGALAANLRKRVHDMSVDVEQTQLEDLKQSARARTDDDYICFDRHDVLFLEWADRRVLPGRMIC